MAVYIVTYDLNAPGKDYKPLIAAIQKYTNCYALKSAFFVDSNSDAQTIISNLSRHLDANDSLYVMELRNNWWANRTLACVGWLKAPARTWT